MKEMNKVIVKINGSEYPMVGEKSEPVSYTHLVFYSRNSYTN